MRRYGLLLVFASSECRAGALSFGRMSCAACPPPRGCSRLVRLRRPTDALDPLRLEDLLVRQRDKGCLSRSCLPTDALDPSTPSPGTSGIAYPLAGHAHVALDPTLPCPRLALAPAGAGALCLPLGDGHAPHRRPSRPRRPPHQVTAPRDHKKIRTQLILLDSSPPSPAGHGSSCTCHRPCRETRAGF